MRSGKAQQKAKKITIDGNVYCFQKEFISTFNNFGIQGVADNSFRFVILRPNGKKFDQLVLTALFYWIRTQYTVSLYMK